MFSNLYLYLLGKHTGFDMVANRRNVTESQYWTRDQIRQYQEKHLKSLVLHAYQHVTYYKQYFDANNIHPEDIQDIESLSNLKILHKSDIQQSPLDFLADNASDYHIVHHHTGGTTGIPFEYYNDRASWALNWALKMRTFDWGGFTYGKNRLGVMAGGSLNPNKNIGLKHRMWRWLNNYYTMPITNMDNKTMSEYASHLRQQKISFLRGYPSAIETFADFLITHNIKIQMKAVFTTAEMLLDHQRSAIKKAFGCEVFDTYGCGDGMGQANECEFHHGLHICHETSILQIVDSNGKEVAPGEIGEIVLTSLYDYGMPLIRYAPGDMAIKANYDCPCGRHMPMIDKIIGRTSDIFRLKNGRILNGLSIPFEELTKELKRFQIIQESEDKVIVLLEKKSELSDYFLENIKNMMKHNCGEGINIEINVVNHIDVPESNKFRYIISKVHNGK